MKIMEVLKLWVRCIAATGNAKNNPIAVRQLVILARAAQEYYTSGLHTQDIMDEIDGTHSHPYIYDGKRHQPAGLAKIVGKYNIKNPYIRMPEKLADNILDDRLHKIITPDGDIDYTGTQWPKSLTLRTACDDLNPQDGLPLALAKMLLTARQK